MSAATQRFGLRARDMTLPLCKPVIAWATKRRATVLLGQLYWRSSACSPELRRALLDHPVELDPISSTDVDLSVLQGVLSLGAHD